MLSEAPRALIGPSLVVLDQEVQPPSGWNASMAGRLSEHEMETKMLELAGVRLQQELGIQREGRPEIPKAGRVETREERRRRLGRIRSQRHRKKLKDARSDVAALILS